MTKRFADRRGCAQRLGAISLIVMIECAGCGEEPRRGPVLSGGREVKSWVNDLGNRSAKVRRVAVLKLGNVGDGEPIVVESLLKALGDADPLVRRDAIMGIVKFKKPTQAVRDQLEKVSRMDKDPAVREHAAEALGHLEESR